MTCDQQSDECRLGKHEQLPDAYLIKGCLWTSAVLVGLILLAASVVFLLKAIGILPQDYTYYKIVIDFVVVPCIFWGSMLLMGVARHYVQRILPRRKR
jgi:hypothetical protein